MSTQSLISRLHGARSSKEAQDLFASAISEVPSEPVREFKTHLSRILAGVRNGDVKVVGKTVGERVVVVSETHLGELIRAVGRSKTFGEALEGMVGFVPAPNVPEVTMRPRARQHYDVYDIPENTASSQKDDAVDSETDYSSDSSSLIGDFIEGPGRIVERQTPKTLLGGSNLVEEHMVAFPLSPQEIEASRKAAKVISRTLKYGKKRNLKQFSMKVYSKAVEKDGRIPSGRVIVKTVTASDLREPRVARTRGHRFNPSKIGGN